MNEKGLQIFLCIADLRDELILESDIRAGAALLSPHRNRFRSFFTSGWGVAILCAVVSLGVVTGMLMLGRGTGNQPPTPPTLDTGTTASAVTEADTEPDMTVDTEADTEPDATVDSDETLPEDTEPERRLVDYNAVLDACRRLVRLCIDHPDERERQMEYEEAFAGVNAGDKAICDKLFLSISDYGAAHGVDSFGYAVVNVNCTGERELVLLGSDRTLLAILSASEDGVVLLDAFHNSYGGYIDKNGLLVTGGDDDVGKPTTWKYRIAPDDASLLVVSTREGAGLSSVMQTASTQNKRSLDAYYTPLFGEPADRSEEVNLAKQLYYDRVMEYYYQWGPDPYIGVHIILIDLNEDGMPEAIVEHGCSVYILYFHEGAMREMFVANTDNVGIYGLKMDGTAGYSSTTGDSYGARRLRVNGENVEWIDLWRVENGGEQFYVQGGEVTKEEFFAYNDAMCDEHASWYGWSKEQIEECFA